MHNVLALDQGTTSSRAIIFDDAGQPISIAQQEFPQSYPQPGWVEHDPETLWQTQAAVAVEALQRAGITAREVAAIGIANQRETTLLWERTSGRAIARGTGVTRFTQWLDSSGVRTLIGRMMRLGIPATAA